MHVVKDLPYIDHLWDVESINARIEELQALINYGSNYSNDAVWTIQILEARRARLSEE